MQVKIFSHQIDIEEAPVHVAPGGSELIRLTGKAPYMAKLLEDLREEIAYGMIDAQVLDEADLWVWVCIYVGNADMDDWMRIWSNEEHLVDLERLNLEEEHYKTGYSMATRNKIIEALKV